MLDLSDCLVCQLLDALDKAEAENEDLRRMLWLNHGCSSALYGDDGEMQCQRHALDFKRQSIDELKAGFLRAALARKKSK